MNHRIIIGLASTALLLSAAQLQAAVQVKTAKGAKPRELYGAEEAANMFVSSAEKLRADASAEK